MPVLGRNVVPLADLAAGTPGEAGLLLTEMRRQSARIVLTNGCFDILHAGHIAYLVQARLLGDYLIVGVNDDASVRALKGPGRPVNPVEDRALVLAALRPVDLVVIFGGPTAEELIRVVRPAVYAKGADYTEATLPEAHAAREVGAEIRFIPLLPGRSTTSILTRLSGDGTII